jgi:uncharacterized protein with PIN domain
MGDKRKVAALRLYHRDSRRLPRQEAEHDHHPGAALSDVEMIMTDDRRFAADAMLGKLAKWLRVMGIDAVYDPDIADAQLVQCAEREGRVMLTRDRRLIRRRGSVQRLFIESDYYQEQVRQVVQAFNLAGRIQLFTRCIRCNAPLRTTAKQVVVGRVPSYVYATQMAFKHCAACDRLYWGGTHRDNMLRQLQAMLGDMLPMSFGTPH